MCSLHVYSCIFKCDRNNPNEYRPALGSLFGNMTDELKAYGAGTFITDFLSGGPKFYAFRAFVPSTAETVECCMVKGISLNSTNSHKISFDSVERLIAAYFEANAMPIVLNYNAIRRTRTKSSHAAATHEEAMILCKWYFTLFRLQAGIIIYIFVYDVLALVGWLV